MRPSFELKQKGGRFVRLLFVVSHIQDHCRFKIET